MAAFATPAELVVFAETPLDAPRMTVILDAASALIRSFTGQELSEVSGDSVEFAPLAEERVIFLPERPVTAVSEVTLDGVVQTEYRWTRWGTLSWLDGGSWEGTVVVTYDHGFPSGSPELETVRAVCLEAAARCFTQNVGGAAEVYGGTLMETANFSPALFLTVEEKALLSGLGLVPVG